ncbi:hypothetical protein DRF65_07270 [Chryseobacterium pennae]|uniref:Uncharacterized protein n=1 Tax=Chryseobacterium pennae TaxID=2258962 RepID=A0A3D9CAX5_9FLAO|nr:hypothetical protein [Chryseobacterium pennae]REC63023.1 hypothetical protein DRF65_07270 [Chryseobacterium pennae]
MKRNISIYMFDGIKAARNLYEDLQHRIYHTITFKNYIEEKENGSITFNRILEYIRNDINMMPPNDFYEIIHFFRSQIYPLFAHDSLETREAYLKTLYDYLGITRLYELDTLNAGKAYAYLYENYVDYFPIARIRGKYFSANIQSEDFLHFNDFLILMTKRIIESKLYDYDDVLTEEEESIIETIRLENQQNLLLSEAIEDQMKFLINVFFPDDRQDFIQAVYHAYTFLKQAIRIRSMIDLQKNPRVIIVDIY